LRVAHVPIQALQYARVLVRGVFRARDAVPLFPIDGQLDNTAASANCPLNLYQYHTLTRPSFLKDRLERMTAWSTQYLLSSTP
jgi:hypothetical protein